MEIGGGEHYVDICKGFPIRLYLICLAQHIFVNYTLNYRVITVPLTHSTDLCPYVQVIAVVYCQIPAVVVVGATVCVQIPTHCLSCSPDIGHVSLK